MRDAFTILDKLIKNRENSDLVFVWGYYNAGQVINTGGRGGRKDKPDGDKP